MNRMYKKKMKKGNYKKKMKWKKTNLMFIPLMFNLINERLSVENERRRLVKKKEKDKNEGRERCEEKEEETKRKILLSPISKQYTENDGKRYIGGRGQRKRWENNNRECKKERKMMLILGREFFFISMYTQHKAQDRESLCDVVWARKGKKIRYGVMQEKQWLTLELKIVVICKTSYQQPVQ